MTKATLWDLRQMVANTFRVDWLNTIKIRIARECETKPCSGIQTVALARLITKKLMT